MPFAFTDLLVQIRKLDGDRGAYPVVADPAAGGARYEGWLDVAKLPTAAPTSDGYGEALFDALFSGGIRDALTVARTQAEADTKGHFRLRLAIEPGAAELQSYVWERLVLSDREAEPPLAIDEESPFSRFSPSRLPEHQPVTQRPIRILVAIANPEELPAGLAPLDVDAEVRSLREALGELARDAAFRVTVMPGRTGLSPELLSDLTGAGYRVIEGRTSLDGIVAELQSAPGHNVLHLVAHGRFRPDPEGQGGGAASIYLEDLADGAPPASVSTDGAAIVTVLGSLGGLLPALVFLQACQSGTTAASGIHPFVGLGPKLVEAGVPAVVAMQDLVPVPLARKLTAGFYASLHRHGLVDLAMNEARRLVYAPDDPDWAIPVLFTRLVGGRLFGTDISSMLRAMGPGGSRVRELVEYHRASFGGRVAQLAALDAFLEGDRPYGLLREPSGRGKTALLVRWVGDLEAEGDWTVVFVPVSQRFQTASASDLVALEMLAYGLSKAYGEELDPELRSRENVRDVIAALLQHEPPDGSRLLVVVDGVDQAQGWRWPAEVFPRTSPPRLKAVVSTGLRADESRARCLQELGWGEDRLAPGMVQSLALPPLELADVRDVLRHADLTPTPELDDALMALTGGEPARLRVIAEDLRAGRTSPQQLTSRRDGYDGYLASSGTATAEPDGSAVDDRPLVDRRETIELLRSRIERTAEARTGAGLALVGESGSGKSRLVDRAIAAAEEREMLVLHVACAGRTAEGLLPFRDTLASYLGRSPERIQEILIRAAPALLDYMPFVESFLEGIGQATVEGPRIGGPGPQAYMGLADLLLGLADARGLCLAIEDLTDADQETLSFLDYFLPKARSGRVVTISTVKEEFAEEPLDDRLDAWRANGFEVSPVPPLARADADALMALLWSHPPLDASMADRIYGLTGGNPFFIEQVVELMNEDPAAGEAWAATDEDAAIAMPERLAAVLRRRLRRADRETRRFLEAAAVVLETSRQLEPIAHVLEVDGATALDLLRNASELHCVVEDAQGGISFAQDLLRRLVYGDIGAQARRFLHTRAAGWFEGQGLLASAAHHFGAAGLADDLVRTAMEGGARAEHVGMYRSAMELYELARPFVAIAELGPKLCNAYLAVGRWNDAEGLLEELPAEALPVRRLRSYLSFLRGDFDGALQEMQRAAEETPETERAETLIRLAEINLYLGELGTAAGYANEALTHADQADIAMRARCQGALGATAFFAGRVDEGEGLFRETMTMLSAQPLEERDRQEYTTILGNLGQASEARGDWEGAKANHEEALRLRRAVSDARGALQSTHALARTMIGLGAVDAAVGLLREAWRTARGLGDRLEEGKIQHTCADLEWRLGRSSSAVRFATRALARFRESRVAYDVTHARFSLARALAADGAERRALEEAATARAQMERQGFGLLARLFPDLSVPYPERIAAGLVAYACGDALGLPWEGRGPDRIDAALIASLPAIADRPRGATSDDTALTLLVAEHLIASGRPDGAGFIRLLAERAASMEGLGPSTTHAVEEFRRTGAPPAGDGNTNGALMRSLPIGWALPLDRQDERRAWTVELSQVTHPGPEARCAACIGSACAAWALEGASPSSLLDVAREEAAAARAACGADGRIEDVLASVAAATWTPDPAGISMDPYETLAAALWCITTNASLADALVAAVRIGGDTDTVAALVGGLLGCGLLPDEVRAQLPWSRDVQAPDGALVRRLAAGIADLRIGADDG